MCCCIETTRRLNAPYHPNKYVLTEGLIIEKTFAKHQRKVFPQFKVKELEVFPIPIDNPDLSEEKNRLIKNVQMIIKEYISLQLCKTQSDIDMHNSKIEFLNKQVDKIVYTLFGLDSNDIALIEQ